MTVLRTSITKRGQTVVPAPIHQQHNIQAGDTLAWMDNGETTQAVEAASGRKALQYITRQRFDLVILDLNMPEMDGTEVLQAARPLAQDTVFIILTAYGTLDSAIAGIRHGAFDYLLKPGPLKNIVRAVETGLAERRRLCYEEPVVLLERALANLKAATQQPETSFSTERFLQAPDITVDTLRRLIVVRGQPVDLTPTEFDILAYLVRHQDRVRSPTTSQTGVRPRPAASDTYGTRSRVYLRRPVRKPPGFSRWSRGNGTTAKLWAALRLSWPLSSGASGRDSPTGYGIGHIPAKYRSCDAWKRNLAVSRQS